MNNEYLNNNYNNNSYGYNQNNVNNPQQPMYNNYGTSKCKLTLTREKSFVGCLVSFKIYIDNEKVGKIKNGKTLVLDVTPGQHVITINKKNPVTVMIMGDSSADVVIFGSNSFGITNFKDSNNSNSNNITDDRTLNRCKSSADFLLYFSIFLPILSVIMYLVTNHEYILGFYFYSILIGYFIINIYGLKNIRKSYKKEYTSLLIKNCIACFISVVSLIVTFSITY